uniref:Uncharacterized protein n=1 Tax=Melanopsichium pennsylvanicum 4 TaxID=1398559 RepID=A0A077RAM3_9BASI|nr:putative protein [Melanopsichium pennsylvanicum 4]
MRQESSSELRVQEGEVIWLMVWDALYDDTTSGIRETGDNAWASVVKARRGVKLRVLETLQTRTGIEENGGSGDGESSVESSTTTSTNPLNPSQTTKYTLNVYRIFTKDPTAWSDDWVPLDPLASTTVVEMVGVVGGMVDQAHFNAYCSTGDAAAATRAGLDPESTIENAIEFADTVAKALRGLVDLRREAYD